MNFVPLPGQDSLGVKPEQVVAVIASINAPSISVSDSGTEPAKAYIVGVQLPSGQYSVAVYLHMLHSNTPVIYRPEPLATTLDGYPSVEASAIAFVESMGFMLENLNFRAQSNVELARLVEVLPFFRPLPALAEVVVGTDVPVPVSEISAVTPSSTARLTDEERAKLGMLLGAF